MAKIQFSFVEGGIFMRISFDFFCLVLVHSRHFMTDKLHILQTLLHLIQVSVSYILMLIVMLFNLWLCLAIVSGAAVGYYFFGWIRRSKMDPNECCN